MSVYKRPESPFYWAKLYSQGSVVRFSTGERTKVKALCKEREKAEQLKAERNLEGRYSVATLAAKFLLWKEANNRRAGSIRSMEYHLRLHIIPFLGAERDARTVTVKDFEQYKADRMARASAQTVGKELSTLRQVFDYAAHVHRIIAEIPRVKNPTFRYEPKWTLLTEAQLEKLLAEIAQAKRRGREALPYFVLMANTGMRGGEISGLRWEMVDFATSEIRLPGEITKSRRPRAIPMNPFSTWALRSQKKENAIGRVFRARHFYDTWRAACERAGLGKVRPHDLRHTFGSLLHKSGEGGPVIRDIMGHVTMTMENHYAHTYQSQLHGAVAKVVVGVKIDPDRAQRAVTSKNENEQKQVTTKMTA